MADPEAEAPGQGAPGVELHVAGDHPTPPLPPTPEETADRAEALIEPYTRDMAAAFTDLISDGLGMIARDPRWPMTEREHNWIDQGLRDATAGTRFEQVVRQAPKGRLAVGVIAWLRRRLDYVRDDIAAWRSGMSVPEYLEAVEHAGDEPEPRGDEPEPRADEPGAGWGPSPRAGGAARLHAWTAQNRAGPGRGPESRGVPDREDDGRPGGFAGADGAGAGGANPSLRGKK